MSSPSLVYDHDCGFCSWCARVARRWGDFQLVGFDEVTPDQRARLPDDWEECFHLLTDDAVYSCGEALEQTLVRMHPVLSMLVRGLAHLPGYERGRDGLYRWGASHRDWWGKVVSSPRA